MYILCIVWCSRDSCCLYLLVPSLALISIFMRSAANFHASATCFHFMKELFLPRMGFKQISGGGDVDIRLGVKNAIRSGARVARAHGAFKDIIRNVYAFFNFGKAHFMKIIGGFVAIAKVTNTATALHQKNVCENLITKCSLNYERNGSTSNISAEG